MDRQNKRTWEEASSEEDKKNDATAVPKKKTRPFEDTRATTLDDFVLEDSPRVRAEATGPAAEPAGSLPRSDSTGVVYPLPLPAFGNEANVEDGMIRCEYCGRIWDGNAQVTTLHVPTIRLLNWCRQCPCWGERLENFAITSEPRRSECLPLRCQYCGSVGVDATVCQACVDAKKVFTQLMFESTKCDFCLRRVEIQGPGYSLGGWTSCSRNCFEAHDYALCRGESFVTLVDEAAATSHWDYQCAACGSLAFRTPFRLNRTFWTVDAGLRCDKCKAKGAAVGDSCPTPK